ncbi:hypothetical protein HSBAA_15140 [Vreelandella sulfidaeris]|uniref:NADP-dependent oxidoreductase domain-containing protein n=1 Tax=Vreelandella sulfidaeris TaxID=115553 RepID=A0A455U7I4_9GAMM|nr:hypothetical protein HSBAA_15140 [Halomonas sulfidaeris]
MIAIPKAVNLDHLKQNFDADNVRLDEDDLAQIDAAYPPANAQALFEDGVRRRH